ncbi:sacsin-like, partial [Sinocyclocheilus grahami]|uniref:sacsin-like n=1 Tax=Sinocyclocheilus grahami TaxID=75366 RepID=UPI0007ACD854
CWSSSFNHTFTGRAFCSLPLPGQTGLPVHVNANFEVDSSRRDLWKEDGDSVKTEWNQLLKKNIISPLYADLLLRLCSAMKKDTPTALAFLKIELESSCLKYFPCISKEVDKVWHEMIHEVYRSINQRDLPVIPTAHSVPVESSHLLQDTKIHKYTVTWCSVSEPHSENCPYVTTEEHDGIFEILDDTGMKLVPCSWKMHEIKDNFKLAGVNVAEISPSTVMNFLKQRSLNDPSQTTSSLPLPINQTQIKNKTRCSKLLRFCLKNVNEKNVHDLSGLPLLLTEDQMLRVFDSKSPKLISRFNSLFQGHQEMFADMVVNRNHVQILHDGKFIKGITIDIAATYLKPEISILLRQSLPDQRCQLYKADTETIKWLKTLWTFFDDQEKSYQNGKLNVFSEIKKHFDDSPILPVICPSQNNTRFLQTMKNISKVIQYENEKVASILIKLGFMKIDLVFFTDLSLEFRLNMNPELLQTGDSSAVLGQVYHVAHSQFEELSKDECIDLQRFLQHGIRDSNNKSQYVSMLKSLPLFESISGKRERIDLHRVVFILNSKHQNDFPNLYHVDGCESIFLKHTVVNIELAECLKIQILDDLEFCVQFILPSVHMMKEDKLLDLLRLLVELGPVDHRIVSALKEVRFIRDIQGSLQVASYFYDDSVHLYREMLPKERFVPEMFWKIFQDKRTEALHLLKDLGLKHEVSDEEIIQFAKQIESETRGNISLGVLKKRSQLLFKTVLSKSNDKKSDLLSRVANIKFIFPVQIQQELCDYHKAFAQDREVVAISGSLIGRDGEHQYMIWTSMPILPLEYCSPHHMKKMKDAGALETPPPEKIAANLKNICRSPCHTDRLLETRKNVFSKSYAYLQSINFDASLFSDLPIILVENETTLVKAKKTALVLHDAFEFRPYLYNIPSKYMKFEDFFKKIGVEESPTIEQYSTVLQEIYSDSSDKDSLQANQQKTVKRVVEQLFCLLKKEQNKTIFFPNNQLYLPSTDGKIYDSCTLFFNDTFFQAARLEGPLETKLKLLEKFNCCHLGNDHYEHQTLLQFLPEHVRPKFLSDVISENLEGTSVQYCEYEGECEFGGWFDKHLSSAAFLYGLVCLIREESKGSVSQSEAAEKCEEIFSKIQIICCKTLQTELLLNLEPLEGSKAETDVYVKKQQNGCSFYLKHNDDMAHKVVNEVNMCLTKEINALLKNCLPTSSLLVLGQLLLCDNMEDVEKTLAKYGIHSSGHKEEGHGSLPKPGCHIPKEWHDCLDMNFLNNFESGEYVGFSKDDSGEYFYAIVIERVDDPLGQARQFPARYKIQVGNDDFIEVSSLDLYQFKREKATMSKGSTCTDIERLLTSRPPPKTVFPETLEEIKREIDQSLNEIWKMTSEDKQKALKRLYLRWHPDKNPGKETLATEAFKYLQNRIEELQQGKTAQSTSSNWRDFRDFYDTWNTEARSHRRGRERFYQNYSRRHYNFWSYHRETPRPNRGEAKRWYEQAQCDIRAAHNDTGGENSEWCLFKVHQAVEKALIAAMYRESGHHPNNCSITSLAQQVSHFSSQLASLPSTVRQLTELGVDGKKTQYPNYHQFPHIPNKQFGVNNARMALDIATKLLKKIEDYVS